MTDTAEIKTAIWKPTSALPPEETERLGGEIVAALKTVFDPEIPADIYELGLIYKVDIKDDRSVDVDDDADHAELSGGRRIADHGGERGRQRSRRRRRQCQSGLGPGLDAGPDERRGAPRPQYVVRALAIVHGKMAGIDLPLGLTT